MKAVFLTANSFEDVELIYPYYRLLEAGFEVDIATPDAAPVTGRFGICLRTNYIDIRKLDQSNYDLIVILGGFEAPDRVRQIPEVLSFLRLANQNHKVIAAICHGPRVLISAGLVKGLRATCYQGCKDDLINAGAIFLDQPVVIDNNIITSPHPKSMPQWMVAILAQFKK